MSTEKGIRWERDGDLLRIVFQRPPLNILNMAMLQELARGLEEAGREPPAVVLLRGEGKAFSAGVEVAEHLGEMARPMIETFHTAFRALWNLPAPVVAVLHGATLGGALELVAAADIVLATPKATLGVPEIRLGVFPPVACALFPALLGWQGATRLVLTGQILSAEEAREAGLVAEVVAEDQLEARVEEVVGELRKLSPSSLRLTKKALRRAALRDLEGRLKEAERIYLEELMETHDATEGLKAFLEKRPPRWSGA
jgi:cyclohexa-1,5-dienecarbonyl-CoA hydratase